MFYMLIKCFLDFLWEGKPPRIAYNTILGAVERGGLGLMDRAKKKQFKNKNSKEVPTRRDKCRMGKNV